MNNLERNCIEPLSDLFFNRPINVKEALLKQDREKSLEILQANLDNVETQCKQLEEESYLILKKFYKLAISLFENKEIYK